MGYRNYRPKNKFRRNRRVTSYRRRNYRRTRVSTVARIVRNMAEKKMNINSDNFTQQQGNNYAVREQSCSPPSGTGKFQRIGNRIQITSIYWTVVMRRDSEDSNDDAFCRIIVISPKSAIDINDQTCNPSLYFYNGIAQPANENDLFNNLNAIPNKDAFIFRYDKVHQFGNAADFSELKNIRKRIAMKGECSFNQDQAGVVNEPQKRIVVCYHWSNTGNNEGMRIDSKFQFRFIDL